MHFYNMHLSDEDLLALIDGEACGRVAKRWRRHIFVCRRCQVRMSALRNCSDDVSALYRRIPAQPSLRMDGFRASLHSRVSKELTSSTPALPTQPRTRPPQLVLAICLLISIGSLTYYQIPFRNTTNIPIETKRLLVPTSGLTPGKTRVVTLSDICGGRYGKNAEVVAAVRQQVFANYGLQGAKASDYEVDYLITPALGGVDDLQNLWPQPYDSTVWNAHAKDALEDKLQQMVCSGELDLHTAQKDIARNWIVAYRKYVHKSGPDQSGRAPDVQSHF
jgi:hypothetical protein